MQSSQYYVNLSSSWMINGYIWYRRPNLDKIRPAKNKRERAKNPKSKYKSANNINTIIIVEK